MEYIVRIKYEGFSVFSVEATSEGEAIALVYKLPDTTIIKNSNGPLEREVLDNDKWEWKEKTYE